MGEKSQKLQKGGRGSAGPGREFSSGGVVFKKEKGQISWLVCKSNPSKDYPGDYWRLPKGWMDDINDGLEPGPISSGKIKATEEQFREGALKEVREEGGVEVEIIKKIGTSRYFIRRGLKFVAYYLMKWKRDLPEGFGFETEKVEWLPFDNAFEYLDHPEEKKILKKASEALSSTLQPSLLE